MHLFMNQTGNIQQQQHQVIIPSSDENYCKKSNIDNIAEIV